MSREDNALEISTWLKSDTFLMCLRLFYVGPPPPGGSKVAAPTTATVSPVKKYDVGELPPPPPAATSSPASIIASPTKPTSAVPAPVTSVVSQGPTTPQTNAPAPKPITNPPSSTDVKTTLYQKSNVVDGVQRGAFGELYGQKAAGSVPASSKPTVAAVPSPVVSVPLPAPPASDDTPPPPPPPTDDSTVPPPPPPEKTPLQEELSSALKGGFALKKVPLPTPSTTTPASAPSPSISSHPPLPTPPSSAAPPKPFSVPTSAPAPPAVQSAPSRPPVAASAPALPAAGASNPFLMARLPTVPSAPAAPVQICTGCQKAIDGEVLEIGDGRNFHPNCFRCARCQQPVTDSIMEVQGRPYHSACLLCATCGVNLADQPFAVHPTTGATFCATHARQAQQASQPPPPPPPAASNAAAVAALALCKGCGVSTIGSSESLISSGDSVIYHARCLRCATCQCQLSASGNVYSQDGQFFCEKDYMAKFAQSCHGCQRPCVDEAMAVGIGDGKKLTFHPQCFNCSQCRQPLQGGSFYLKGQSLVCEKCA